MPVIDTTLQKESREKYLTYALSVVSGRALPDVRDGLKPVQRRILYAMAQNLKLTPSASHRKSATVVGEVLGRYHPHGDTACYDAMVRMAQPFSLRYPLVDGQGNFGSLDGDNPAAYRYTEAKLRELALELIGEIDQETVPFRDNFDSSTEEPVVLPSRVPNLLINGASGIAVGMATNIPPHNLRDTIKALIELLNDPELKNSRLVTLIKAPDFPTGCQILNTKKELDELYRTGRGAIRMRGDWDIEETARGKKFIVISTIPYAVNKSSLIEKIANLIIAKKVPQLSDVRDESTDKVRIVLELAPNADAEAAMAYLYKHTPLEASFSVNLTALVPVEGSIATRPELLSLKECLQHFLDFRFEVVRKKLLFERKKLLERIHILEGLCKIYDNLDAALKMVRNSQGRSDAAAKLMKRFKLSEIQSFAVVDMRIYQLSKTSIEDIRKELAEKQKRVTEIDKILKSKKAIASLIQKDLEQIVEEFGDNRLCKIIKDQDTIDLDYNAEDYIVQEEVYAIVTADGWIKRIRQSNELESTRLREGDSIVSALGVTTHDSVALFTNQGNLYVLPVSDFPSSSGYGSPIQKVLKFKDGESIVKCFAVAAGEHQQDSSTSSSVTDWLDNGDTLVLLSKQGKGFALEIEGVEATKRSGKRVMKVKADDAVATVFLLNSKVAMFTKNGFGMEIPGKEIPVRSSSSVGNALIGVRADDTVVAATAYARKAKLCIVFDKGREKEISSADVHKGKRAQKGQKVITRGKINSVHKV